MRCLVFGSSGATGQSLVKLLMADDKVSYIFLLNRKEMNYLSKKVVEKVVDPLFNLDESHIGSQIDAAFCCIGTTLTKSSQVHFQFIYGRLQQKKFKIFPSFSD